MASQNKVLLTLCVIHQDNRVLLGLKKRGRGEGRWNGFGGKLEDGESMEAAARREVLEEVGLIIQDLEEVGIVDFEFEDNSWNVQVHIFKSTQFAGQPIETDEMKPEWFTVDTLPLDAMWPGDAYWFPLLLENKKFRGHFLYDRPSTSDYASVILKKSIEEVDASL